MIATNISIVKVDKNHPIPSFVEHLEIPNSKSQQKIYSFIVQHGGKNGKSIGYIQFYRIRAYVKIQALHLIPEYCTEEQKQFLFNWIVTFVEDNFTNGTPNPISQFKWLDSSDAIQIPRGTLKGIQNDGAYCYATIAQLKQRLSA